MFEGISQLLSGIKNLFFCRTRNTQEKNTDSIDEQINNDAIQEITYESDGATHIITLVTEIIYDVDDLSKYNLPGSLN